LVNCRGGTSEVESVRRKRIKWGEEEEIRHSLGYRLRILWGGYEEESYSYPIRDRGGSEIELSR
jgi:hypothetical protein